MAQTGEDAGIAADAAGLLGQRGVEHVMQVSVRAPQAEKLACRRGLAGSNGKDTYVLRANEGVDTVGDFQSGEDRLQISWSQTRGTAVGDGDALIENAADAELVLFTQDIAGDITAASAAAAIGSASPAYATGATRIFAVDKGGASAVYLFTSAGNDAQMSNTKLVLLATLQNSASTTLADYAFSNVA